MKPSPALPILILAVILLVLPTSCQKDTITDPPPPVDQIMTDIDGNQYHTVTIGAQVWTVENLRTTRFRNGDTIPAIAGDSTWAQRTQASCCVYNNDPANKAAWGILYNWPAVNDTRKICPAGWHVATDADWTQLAGFLIQNGHGYEGSGEDIAKAIAAPADWELYDVGGTVGNRQEENNISGMTALPGGWRNSAGLFTGSATNCFFWTSSLLTGSTNVALYRMLSYKSAIITRSNSAGTAGMSVRCIKD